jgi:hypothetical protein
MERFYQTVRRDSIDEIAGAVVHTVAAGFDVDFDLLELAIGLVILGPVIKQLLLAKKENRFTTAL